VVTGAASGIEAAIAADLAESGSMVASPATVTGWLDQTGG
jgi:NADP-dependent 3-hydroxy acid dehydrogenase YdfG